MPKTMEAPSELHEVIDRVEQKVAAFFKNFKLMPDTGRILIDNHEYMLVRLQAIADDLRKELKVFMDDNGANLVLYKFGQAIGRSDCKSVKEILNLDSFEEISVAGPIFGAYTGFVRVKLLPGSNITQDENFFLIYEHPNNFEAKYAKEHSHGSPICYFNAGYSSGWFSEAIGFPLEATEVLCEAKGDPACRFIMYPADKEFEYTSDLSKWQQPM